LQGDITRALLGLKGQQDLLKQNDQQAHEAAMAAADAAAAEQQAEREAEEAEKMAAQGHVYKVNEATAKAPTNGAGA